MDVPFEVETDGVRQSYILIDTAGVRQKRRVDDSVEFFSVKRTEDSIARCDIVIFVLDAEAGILEQDKKVADKIVEERKACILVVNKWDLVAGHVDVARKDLHDREVKRREGQARPLTTLEEFGGWVQEHLFFLDYAPVLFTSAKTGFHLDQLLESIRYVASQLRQKVPTAILNRTLNDAILQRQPLSSAGHRLKFFYATQIKQAAADVPALCQSRGFVFRSLQEVSGQGNAARFRLRRLPGGPGSAQPREDHRANPPARTPPSLSLRPVSGSAGTRASLCRGTGPMSISSNHLTAPA